MRIDPKYFIKFKSLVEFALDFDDCTRACHRPCTLPSHEASPHVRGVYIEVSTPVYICVNLKFVKIEQDRKANVHLCVQNCKIRNSQKKQTTGQLTGISFYFWVDSNSNMSFSMCTPQFRNSKIHQIFVLCLFQLYA